MTEACINRIATAVPPYDVNEAFLGFGQSFLTDDPRSAELFGRMALRSGIEHRYSYLSPTGCTARGGVGAADFYAHGRFPGTAARMRLFERLAPLLAETAVERLSLGSDRQRITHLVLTCCTGFSAPGLDLEIMARCGLSGSVERTMIGFMGCYAAINGLKAARHIVRSEPAARVLVVNLELCSLHLRQTARLDQLVSFLIFGDGCAATLVSADPVGLAMDSFKAVLVPDTAGLITWHIGDSGFDMFLSGEVAGTIRNALNRDAATILGGAPAAAVDLWAVHPGGRAILDAVDQAFALPEKALAPSRDILRRFGNMSSATVMFVLQAMLASVRGGERGCAISFGPGLMAETMLFHTAASAG